MDGASREREPALDDPRRRTRPRRRRAGQRATRGGVEASGRRVGIGEIDDKHLADRLTGRRDDRSLEGESPLLSAAVGAAVTGAADPGLLAGPADRVAAGGGLVVEVGDEDAPGTAVVVAGMGVRHAHLPITGAHPHRAEVALVPFGARRRIEDGIFVGEAHHSAIRRELVDMSATAQRARGIGRDEIAGVEGLDGAGSAAADDDPAAAGGAVRPVSRGTLGAKDEHHPVVDRTGGDDSTAGTVARLVEHLDPTGRHLDPLDPRAVEHRTGGIRANVVADPCPVGGPDPGVGEEMAVGGGGDLALVHRWSRGERPVRSETNVPESGAAGKSTQIPPGGLTKTFLSPDQSGGRHRGDRPRPPR